MTFLTRVARRQRKRIFFWTAACLLALFAFWSVQFWNRPKVFYYADSPGRDALKILFVGNSLTYYHDMPGMAVGLLRADQPYRPLKIAMVTGPGATLEDHERDRTVFRVLEQQGPWDWVILQESGGRAVTHESEVANVTCRLAARIQQHGARPLVLVDWWTPPRVEAAASGWYQIAAQLGLGTVPVSDVWHALQRDAPAARLLLRDGIHPTPLGSYVIAYVCVATVLAHLPPPLDPRAGLQLPAGKVIRPGVPLRETVGTPLHSSLVSRTKAVLDRRPRAAREPPNAKKDGQPCPPFSRS